MNSLDLTKATLDSFCKQLLLTGLLELEEELRKRIADLGGQRTTTAIPLHMTPEEFPEDSSASTPRPRKATHNPDKNTGSIPSIENYINVNFGDEELYD